MELQTFLTYVKITNKLTRWAKWRKTAKLKKKLNFPIFRNYCTPQAFFNLIFAYAAPSDLVFQPLDGTAVSWTFRFLHYGRTPRLGYPSALLFGELLLQKRLHVGEITHSLFRELNRFEKIANCDRTDYHFRKKTRNRFIEKRCRRFKKITVVKPSYKKQYCNSFNDLSYKWRPLN